MCGDEIGARRCERFRKENDPMCRAFFTDLPPELDSFQPASLEKHKQECDVLAQEAWRGSVAKGAEKDSRPRAELVVSLSEDREEPVRKGKALQERRRQVRLQERADRVRMDRERRERRERDMNQQAGKQGEERQRGDRGSASERAQGEERHHAATDFVGRRAATTRWMEHEDWHHATRKRTAAERNDVAAVLADRFGERNLGDPPGRA